MRAKRSFQVDRLLDYREFPILFVDDEVENLRIFELTFRREFQVRTARSGEEALAVLNEHPAALVLSDHRMAGLSGVELLAKVREIDPYTIRILVTAYGDVTTLADAINNGWIYRYVPKPWRPDEMRLTLRNGIEVYALGREREELLHELEVLNRTAKQLGSELELAPLLDRILATVTEDLGFDGATVFLFDGRGERLQPLRTTPRAGSLAERLGAFDIAASAAPNLVGRVWEGRTQVLRLSDLLSFEEPVRRFLTELAAEEVVVVPLVGREGALGVLTVDNRRGGQGFGASEVTLLDGLASQAVIALENARLVADLRRSREEMRRVERLGTLGTLAAGLAHEINNPLVAIRTFLSLAPAKRRDSDPEFWGSYHELALREVDRIHELVRTMGRLGSGDRHSERTLCDLREIATDALTLLTPQASRAGVSVVIESEDALPKLWVVRDQIHQVLLNLLLNAIHACTPNPSDAAPVEAPEAPSGSVVLRLAIDGSELCVEVCDDGCGIGSEELERIFDPFFTTKDPDRGSGLGLVIVHRIVEDHGGRVEVESLEGRGSTFRVRLPASEAPSSALA